VPLSAAYAAGATCRLLYWQLVPLAASAGATLTSNARRLPVGRAQLFGLEVLLRFTTGIEMVSCSSAPPSASSATPTFLPGVLAFLPSPP
jgi:hypothetical protein